MTRLAKRGLVSAIVAFAIFQIAGAFLTYRGYMYGDDTFGFDLRLRRSEIRCAHQGVNSFRIWNREVERPGFVPLSRPDREDVPRAPGTAIVHAYPPWHTILCYFYGWLPETMCLSVMSVLLGLSLCLVASECTRLSKARFENGGLVSAVVLSLILCYVCRGYVMLNYGVFSLVAFLLMNKALEKGHDVAAGLCWAVMMVKPQVGFLFVWPLFWHRRYVAIVTATVVCLGATFLASLILHESVIDLILQLPQIGQPYAGYSMSRFVQPFLGKNAMFLVMLAFFVLTGLLSWFVRRREDFLFTCIPVVAAIPLWTYCLAYDYVILLPAFVFLVGEVLSRGVLSGRWMVALFGAYVALLLLSDVWVVAASVSSLDFGFVEMVWRRILRGAQILLFAALSILIWKACHEEQAK